MKQDKPPHLTVSAGTDGLYSQELFRDLLVHERKRSERSKHPFFFVVLDVKAVLNFTRSDVEVVVNIIKAVTSASRETDIKGWYEVPSRMGIIYLETSSRAPEQILNKIHGALVANLGPEMAARIVMTHATFPEDDGKQWTRDRSDEEILYPARETQQKLRKAQLWMKRFIDVTGSSVGLIALAPLVFAVGFLIKVTSPGPVFFRQERIGLGGKKFKLYKFRSMHLNNEPGIHKEFVTKLISGQVRSNGDNKNPVYKINNDPRVTLFGRFIRATSIDELPQLFNVFIGNMSLVGPRPPIGYEVEVYEVWHRPRVLEVRPGITGLWQVKGRSKTTFDGMVRMDLEYIHNWSLWLDIKLLFKTPAAVLMGKGAR